MGLIGCSAGPSEVQPSLRRAVVQNDFEIGYQTISSSSVQSTYGRKSELLYDLERGSLALATGRYDEALEALETADLRGRYDLYGRDGADVLAQWTINERAATWAQQPYADLYVNVLRQIIHLIRSDSDRAVAESREVLSNAEFLRGFYGQYLDRYAQRYDVDFEEDVSLPARYASADGTDGVFVDTTLGTYLAALIFASRADTNRRDLAWDQFQDTARRFGNGLGVDPNNFAYVNDLKRGDVNVALIALTGQAPEIVSAAVNANGPLGFFAMPFPDMIAHPPNVRAAWAEVDGGPTVPLPLVENMAAAASENFKRTAPAIYARTFGRIMLKAVGAVVFDELVVQEQVSDQDLRYLIRYAIFIAIVESEKPDLRTWTTLPGQAWAHGLKLPPGEHRVRFRYETSYGPATGSWQTIQVSETGLTAALGYYGG